jgi:hypothetical protein
MRITIEATAIETGDQVFPEPRVVVETMHDELDAEEALDLCKRALVAWGFHWDNFYDNQDAQGAKL